MIIIELITTGVIIGNNGWGVTEVRGWVIYGVGGTKDSQGVGLVMRLVLCVH